MTWRLFFGAWALLSLGWFFGWVTAHWFRRRMWELQGDPREVVAYRCRFCGELSYDPFDVERHYCGSCFRFEDGSKLGDAS